MIAAIENTGLRFLKQEERYTLKASFLDKGLIPVWSKNDRNPYHFSDKRITQGLSKSKTSTFIHADVNGALNT